MSVAVVVKRNGLVCLGADSLTKYGGIREDDDFVEHSSKIVTLGNSFVAPLGHASFGLIMEKYFRGKHPDFTCREAIFDEMLAFHRWLKDECFLNAEIEEDAPFESSRFQMLIANERGVFGVYDLRSVQEYKRFYSIGSGDELALGAMAVAFDLYEDAEAIARIGIEVACRFDDSCAMPCTVRTVKLVR